MNRYIYLSKRIKISALLPGALFLLLVRSGAARFFCIAAALAVHELGHIIAGGALGYKTDSFTLGLLGADIKYRGVIGYKEDIVIALSGPAANLLTGALFLPVFRSFALYGFAYAALNLAPVEGFDGGRALKALLYTVLPYRYAETAFNAVSLSTLFILYLTGIFILLYTSFNATLFFICIYTFFSCTVEKRS
ncbi:MAG: hypothetical protein II777_07270 [Clostridia bacterium]|nr:hypothetical protein [Clostridia bacterium]